MVFGEISRVLHAAAAKRTRRQAKDSSRTPLSNLSLLAFSHALVAAEGIVTWRVAIAFGKKKGEGTRQVTADW
jgi:hypothetical protein